MKRELSLFLLILLAYSVIAMEDSITVKTSPENYVKLYAWTAGGGPLYELKNGSANENGSFETHLYAVEVSRARLQVLIIEGGKDGDVLKNVEFDNQGLSEPLIIDCTEEGKDCTISVNTEASVEEALIVEETTPENETTEAPIEETQIEEETTENTSVSVSENPSSNIISMGKSIFTKADGSVNLPVIILIVILAIIILFLLLSRNPTKKKKKDPEEEELEELEAKVKEKEKEINSIIEERKRKQKIEDAKRTLYKEENEIKELTGKEDEDYMRLKRIEETKKKLTNDENRLNQLRSSNPKDEERKVVRDNPAVKGFLNNMQKYAGDKPK